MERIEELKQRKQELEWELGGASSQREQHLRPELDAVNAEIRILHHQVRLISLQERERDLDYKLEDLAPETEEARRAVEARKEEAETAPASERLDATKALVRAERHRDELSKQESKLLAERQETKRKIAEAEEIILKAQAVVEFARRILNPQPSAKKPETTVVRPRQW